MVELSDHPGVGRLAALVEVGHCDQPLGSRQSQVVADQLPPVPGQPVGKRDVVAVGDGERSAGSAIVGQQIGSPAVASRSVNSDQARKNLTSRSNRVTNSSTKSACRVQNWTRALNGCGNNQPTRSAIASSTWFISG